MPTNPSKSRARAAFDALYVDKPYAEKRAMEESLREMANTQRSNVFAEAKKAATPPVEPNAMSNAVDRRLSPKPRTMAEIKAIPRRPKQTTFREIPEMAEKIRKEQAEQQAARRFAANYNQEHFSRPNFPPTENPPIYRTGNPAPNLAQRIGGKVADGAERLAKKAIPTMGRAGNAAGRAAVATAEAIVPRSLGRAVPILGDLVLPYGEISGGEMYPTQDGYYRHALGGPLPEQYAAANERTLQRGKAEAEMFGPRAGYVEGQAGSVPDAVSVVPLRTNMAQFLNQPQQRDPFIPLEMQQPQSEPQGFAQQLSQYNEVPEPAEPQSIAHQLASAPEGEYEHYLKVFGTPERAKQALSEKYQQTRPNY